MISLPEDFARATIAREGEEGRRWIAGLAAVVDDLCRDWNLSVDGSVMHGYLGLVVPVRRADEPCMLKVSWIDEATASEPAALTAWAGRGAVRLLDADPLVGAMLLERLDQTRTLNTVAIDKAVTIAGRLLRRLAIPAPAAIRSMQAAADEMAHNIPARWERYGRPVARSLLEQACGLLPDLGKLNERLLVNYDLHYADVLVGTREPWLVVDPKVVAGSLEFGIAQLLWTRLEDIEAAGGLDRHFRALVEAAELDSELARAWTLVRCVDYWLWAISAGLTEDPRRCDVIVNWLWRGS